MTSRPFLNSLKCVPSRSRYEQIAHCRRPDLRAVVDEMGFPSRAAKGKSCVLSSCRWTLYTLPHHKGQDLSRPLIRKILNEVRVSVDAFVEGLK